MGVVSGLVMAYQFGTNWSYFSSFAGSITGPLLAYEVLTAFFLEAGFLGVMLFGWNRVGPGLHFFSTIMVALGTLISATWILASNSWMQTPQGFEIVNGVVVPVDWFEVIFNPSFPYRLAHMTVAAYLATALFVGASGAWHLLRGNDNDRIRTMLSMAMWMLLARRAGPDPASATCTASTRSKHQPAKIAAMEGHWENKPGEGVPLILFGWPDMRGRDDALRASRFRNLGSLILTHELERPVPGPQGIRPRRPAEFDGGVLELPRHGRARPADAAARRSGACGCAGRAACIETRPFLRFATVDGAGRPDRHSCRLVHHRDRPPALGRLRRDAHRRTPCRTIRRWR